MFFFGFVSDIDENFQTYVQQFVSSLLATGNLVVKEINGTQITGQELIEYFKVQYCSGSLLV